MEIRNMQKLNANFCDGVSRLQKSNENETSKWIFTRKNDKSKRVSFIVMLLTCCNVVILMQMLL